MAENAAAYFFPKGTGWRRGGNCAVGTAASEKSKTADAPANIEITEAMLKAGVLEYSRSNENFERKMDIVERIFRAMIEAGPSL